MTKFQFRAPRRWGAGVAGDSSMASQSQPRLGRVCGPSCSCHGAGRSGELLLCGRAINPAVNMLIPATGKPGRSLEDTCAPRPSPGDGQHGMSGPPHSSCWTPPVQRQQQPGHWEGRPPRLVGPNDAEKQGESTPERRAAIRASGARLHEEPRVPAPTRSVNTSAGPRGSPHGSPPPSESAPQRDAVSPAGLTPHRRLSPRSNADWMPSGSPVCLGHLFSLSPIANTQRK